MGDVETWAEALYETNNTIKHNPSISVDPLRTLLLVQSAEVLIACVALDEVAGSRRPSTRYIADHHIQELGQRLRTELGV
jgi:hypothetical protein